MSDPYRQHCQRQHRVLGQYLAIQAWLRCVDCFVIQRTDLQTFLGLERFKHVRIEWLEEDLKPWFPYQASFLHWPSYREGVVPSFQNLFLSRVPIGKFLSEDTVTLEERLARMPSDAPRTQKFTRGRRFPSDETGQTPLTRGRSPRPQCS